MLNVFVPQGAYALFPKDAHFILDLALKATKSSLFQHRTVKEMLWGYHDPFLKGPVGLFLPVSEDTLRLSTSK